jgi:hypothetical protein
MPDDDWPFDQPRNCAVVTLRSIIFEGEPILYVSHDANDNGWQFLDGRPVDMANAALVGLGTIVRHDTSLLELADLPPGWSARRPSKDSPWQRVSPDVG